jgi:hypothetical protein
MTEYASNGKANAALTTGIIGTALGGIASAGGLSSLLGIGPNGGNRNVSPEDKPVTRYEMSLIQQINDKNNEITLLKSNQYTTNVASGLQAQISQQATLSAVQNANMNNLAGQIQEALSISQRFVPNFKLAPGYGPAVVQPFYPPVTPVVPEVKSSSSGTDTTGN